MSRVRDLTPASLDDLPATCRACTFWEAAGPRAGRAEHDAAEGRAGKDAWWHATQLEWGAPAKAVYDGERLIGYAVFAPGEHFARARGLAHQPSDDALLLATLWVDPAYRHGGLGKTLLQVVLREAHRHGCSALEAYATRSPEAPTGHGCVIPEGFLLGHGFQVHQDHHRLPLLRLDLRQTLRWQESIGHALEAVIAAIGRRERAPAPSRPVLRARVESGPARRPPAPHAGAGPP